MSSDTILYDFKTGKSSNFRSFSSDGAIFPNGIILLIGLQMTMIDGNLKSTIDLPIKNVNLQIIT